MPNHPVAEALLPKRETEDLIRVHLWLYTRDMERLDMMFPALQRSEIVRKMVRNYLNQIEARANQGRPVPIVGE